MTILYHPDGTPHEIPHSEVDAFIRKGFRPKPPEKPYEPINPIVLDSSRTGGVDHLGAAHDLHASDIKPSGGEVDGSWTNNFEGDLIKVNTASLKELTVLPGIGTAIAKKIVDNRPYESPEDLIAKVPLPSGSWLAIADKLDFAKGEPD